MQLDHQLMHCLARLSRATHAIGLPLDAVSCASIQSDACNWIVVPGYWFLAPFRHRRPYDATVRVISVRCRQSTVKWFHASCCPPLADVPPVH